ncbi:MAG TPA: hypothetical protein VFJ58_18610 [Armatimonadota bacterium]|nr:hypothetical protein [Armatimonadota bacterium]
MSHNTQQITTRKQQWTQLSRRHKGEVTLVDDEKPSLRLGRRFLGENLRQPVPPHIPNAPGRSVVTPPVPPSQRYDEYTTTPITRSKSPIFSQN